MTSSYFGPAQQRPIKDVPGVVLVLLCAMLALQIGWQIMQPPRVARAEALPAPPPAAILQLLSFGDHIAMSHMLMLWLQAFDNQPGLSIPYQQLDYQKISAWLDVILALDARGQYPLFAASRLYSEIPDEYRQRIMLEFVYTKFIEDPERRWPALAHAVFVAKHRLRDLPLALHYAQALAGHAYRNQVPSWVRTMQVWVLEDLGEMEDARILLGGLVANGTIKDPHELMFLRRRLQQLEVDTGNKGKSQPPP